MLPLVTLLWLLGRAHIGSPVAASEPAADFAPNALAVTLGELRANPGKHLGEELRFTLQFKTLVESWDPLLSRFEPTRWLGFQAWADEAFLWDKSVFDDPAQRLFVRRGGGFEPLVRRARGHARFQARAIVRETFLGEPWIEVLELAPLEGDVGDGTILHVGRARELAATGNFDLALDQYERARLAPLPPHALAAILSEILLVKDARERAVLERGKEPAAQPAEAQGAAAPRPVVTTARKQ